MGGFSLQARESSRAAWRLAVLNQTNAIVLLGALAFALALWSPWPLVIWVVAEGLWLFSCGISPGLRDWLLAKRQEHDRQQSVQMAQRPGAPGGRAAGYAALRTSSGTLTQAYAERLTSLERVVAEIHALAHERRLARDSLAGLGPLFEAFGRMAVLHQRLSQFLSRMTSERLREELARISDSATAEQDPGIKLSLRQSLTLIQRRLVQHEKLESTQRALGIKMSTFELSVEYLRSQVFGGASESELAAEINELYASTGFLLATESEAHAQLAGFERPVTAVGNPRR